MIHRLEKSIILFITNTPIDNDHVVYGSWNNWIEPRKLCTIKECTLTGCPYKKHFCDNRCTIYTYYITNTSIAKGKHYYKLWNTKTNTWIEPNECEKTNGNWECTNGYWNRVFTY
jgi:hypothetical protein